LWKVPRRCKKTVCRYSPATSQTGTSRGSKDAPRKPWVVRRPTSVYRHDVESYRAAIIVARGTHPASDSRPAAVERRPSAYPWPGATTTPAETERNSFRGRSTGHWRRWTMMDASDCYWRLFKCYTCYTSSYTLFRIIILTPSPSVYPSIFQMLKSRLKVKGPDIYIPPITGKPKQLWLTNNIIRFRGGILTSTSSKRRGAASGRPLPERTDFGPTW